MSTHAERAIRNGPNERLRRARLTAPSPSGSGLPMRRQEVADACNEIMYRLQVERGVHRRRAGLTARSVGALERGEIRWPGAEYREAFRRLFDRSDADLGFFVVIGASQTEYAQPEPASELVNTSVLAADVSHVSGPDVARPAVDGETETMNRRELLRVLSIAGGLVALPDGLTLPTDVRGVAEGPRSDALTLGHYAAVNGLLWQTFATSQSKSAVRPLVVGQLNLLTSSLEAARTGHARTRLCELLAELFQLAGEIAFDGNRYVDAAQCYTLAAEAAKEAAAYDLWACALARHAFIGVYERAFSNVLPMLDLAARVAGRGDQMLSTRYWIDVIQGQAFAGAGDDDACRRALDRAQGVVELGANANNGGWLRFDGTRLAEERGSCLVELGRTADAQMTLMPTLSRNLSERRRGSVHVDLALAGIQSNDVEAVLAHGHAALTIAQRTGSGVVGHRLGHLQRNLGALSRHHGVRDLGSEISTNAGRAAAIN